jgi:hypothetical protein
MPELSARTVNQMSIEVLNGAGRAVSVEFAIRPDTVEVWTGGRCAAVLERSNLREWLAHPAGFHGLDDLTWAGTPAGVALTITHVFPWWELAPRDLARLRDLV